MNYGCCHKTSLTHQMFFYKYVPYFDFFCRISKKISPIILLQERWRWIWQTRKIWRKRKSSFVILDSDERVVHKWRHTFSDTLFTPLPEMSRLYVIKPAIFFLLQLWPNIHESDLALLHDMTYYITTWHVFGTNFV